jgi:hypothetical protein
MKKHIERVVEPELLDVLPPQDQRALRSRNDLIRLNHWMNHSRILARALSENFKETNAPRIAELGAGDGHFLLSVARLLKPQWPKANVTLIDRLDTVGPKVRESLNNLGWQARMEIAEIFEWLRQSPPGSQDIVITNLFLHQFQAEDLAEMLRLVSRSTNLVITLEPRRSWLPRLCGHLLWAIGCSPVTRHDANVSIRAGFLENELSAIWPDKKEWDLEERPVGLFTHLFIARRKA